MFIINASTAIANTPLTDNTSAIMTIFIAVVISILVAAATKLCL